MHEVILTGRVIYGPRFWYRNSEPHAEVFLRTATREPGLFAPQAHTIVSHHLRAAGALVLALEATKIGDRLTVQGRLIWTTDPSELPDDRTSVHVEVQALEHAKGATEPDRNWVSLTALLAEPPTPWNGPVTQAVLAPLPECPSSVSALPHLFTALALGDAATELRDVAAGEAVLVEGYLQTDTFERHLGEPLLRATVFVTALSRPANAAPQPLVPPHG